MTDSPAATLTEVKAALFLKSIKSSTAESHTLLESNMLLTSLMAADVSVRQYYCYLVLMQKVEEMYEEQILVKSQMIFPFPVKASQLITEDIRYINYTSTNNTEPVAFHFSVEKMSMPFVLGFMYVMKGSKLGGKVISKHIQRKLGFSENEGARYINDHGVDTFPLWKEFLSIFSKYVIENNCETEATAGAKFAFSSIFEFFQSNRLMYEI